MSTVHNIERSAHQGQWTEQRSSQGLYYILRQKETGGLILSLHEFHRQNCSNGFHFTFLFGIVSPLFV